VSETLGKAKRLDEELGVLKKRTEDLEAEIVEREACEA
jgi:hypothetical protein